jgi:hypothetical protein
VRCCALLGAAGGPVRAQTIRGAGRFEPLIRQYMKTGGCDGPAPDGGPSCREVVVERIIPEPVTGADRLNGVLERKNVVFHYLIFSGSKGADDRGNVVVVRTAEGWRWE